VAAPTAGRGSPTPSLLTVGTTNLPEDAPITALSTHTAITLPTSNDGERGVGGIEVDPHFGEAVPGTGYIYVSYTRSDNFDRLSRFTLTGDTIDPTSELVLMRATQAAGNVHHGGEVEFGPDGKLYWSTGNNGVNANSQDLSNLYGKVLRLNPDGSAPTDNPFVNTPGAVPQIYALGFRNPFRFTFAPDGQLLVADVGENTWEELNVVTAGGNYGWPGAEGPCTGCSFINPIYSYEHNGQGAAIQSHGLYRRYIPGELPEPGVHLRWRAVLGEGADLRPGVHEFHRRDDV
jgi:hypothetical protein